MPRRRGVKKNSTEYENEGKNQLGGHLLEGQGVVKNLVQKRRGGV